MSKQAKTQTILYYNLEHTHWSLHRKFSLRWTGLTFGLSLLVLFLTEAIYLSKTYTYTKRKISVEVESFNEELTSLEANETYFVVMAKLIPPKYQHVVRNLFNITVEFTSRQNLDGKFVHLDDR